MKILYSLPHPADRLNVQQAGHTIRASEILAALEKLGHQVIRLEAGAASTTKTAVSAYRGLVKKFLPRPVAMRLRDAGRVAHGRRYAKRLIEASQQARPDVILETHIAFSLAGKIASEQTGLPLVLDDVTPASEEEQQYGVGLKKIARDIHRQVTDRADLLIAVNKTMVQTLLQDGLPAQKIIIVENGIDGQLFHPQVDGREIRARYGLRRNESVIVYVGSFQPFHRVDLLIRALAQLKSDRSARLLLVGQGRHTAECQALARQLSLLEKVVFAGLVPYGQIPGHVAAADVAVIPAHTGYSNPMKLYEYLALGKAVVAPRQETITEVVTHNRNAYLFEPEDDRALAAALQRLIDDDALRTRLGRQAGCVAADYTWDKRAESIQQALQNFGIGRDWKSNK